ncbi:MAG: hypothetical protein ACHQK8_01175 [Bacteroidia bacterium]
MRKIFSKHIGFKLLVFSVVYIFNNHTFSVAQGDPYGDDYTSIFDFQEENLYLNSPGNTIRHQANEQTYSGGTLFGYSIAAPAKRAVAGGGGETGVPDPPPPPDAPVNSNLVVLMLAGLLLGTAKLFLINKPKPE